ncbi:MAG: leucine-rich repeat domain-containing protein [Paludibacteraceae bacterium]|nr:leucine-rich repeat domain-containing protein [Paludibacteraceae bacterium]
MKKVFTIFAALTLSAGLWAIDNVPYIDANGQPQTANDVMEITSATYQDTWNEGWYVVTGSDVTLSQGAVCWGAVNLILADGAKLTATGYSDDWGRSFPGIQVPDEGSSLTIYGQANQSGQLIANGEDDAAGIGGESGRPGYNITINGGTVIATGGMDGAGIGGGRRGAGINITINGGKVTANGGLSGAGIGGGCDSWGEKITINGGIVTAIGGEGGADGIGSGAASTAYDIFVATSLVVKADNNNPPTTVIAATRTATTDIADYLRFKRYATVEPKPVPHNGDQFVDTTSVLKFEVTAVGDTNTVKVMKNDYSGTSYTVPDTVKYLDVDFAVTEIGYKAFYACESLQSITIPAGVTEIGESAFEDCWSLQSVTLPASVTTIGEYAFQSCESLQSVTLSEGLLTIEEGAFTTSGLTSITIPAGVISLGMGAFAECAGLTSVTFLGNACQDAIGELAFYEVGKDAPALLTLPDNWTGSKPDEDGNWYGGKFAVPGPKVGDRFEDATSGLWFEATAVGDTNTVKVIKNNYTATSYIVPDTVKYLDVDFAVTEIGESAFERCSSLESVTLPEGLLTIGENAFEECSALQTITIPASVTEIGADAFNSSALQSITIPAGVTEIGGTAFCGCESLQSVTLSEGLLTIGEAAFQSCVSLQSITIPAGVTTIGMAAFAGSGLQTITIPAGVISLGMGAFAECAGLTSVTFLGNACQDAIGELAFYEVGKDAPALLTLPDNWTGSKPDEDGNWYGGKFELSEDPSALPTVKNAVKATKVLTNGQVIFRKENKNFSILGQEVR